MFSNLIGNERVKKTLTGMIERQRIPGSMLFCGEEGIGKKLFALELAKAVNCRTPVGVEACGECPSCRRIDRIDYPSADDREAHKRVIWTEHPEVGIVRPKGRNILVDAMRDVEKEANFRPFEGRARFFIIEEADRLNDSSSNALLKTLEEPPPTAHLILITSQPSSLLATIRSRCQVIRFTPQTADEIYEHLMKSRQFAARDAQLLSRVSGGSIGRALSIDLAGFKEMRAAMLDILNALTVTNDRVKLLRGSEEMNDAKHKDEYEERLNLLAMLVHDLWIIATGANTEIVANDDLRPELQQAASRISNRRAASWLFLIEKHRRGFEVNMNRKVATDALFLSMAAA
jgi:DNA polymerase-3 subunit delta'